MRCGVDMVDLRRFERFLNHCDARQLRTIFADAEVRECGGKKHSLAERFAAKEACLKLFPRETALHDLDFEDFEIALDDAGAPQLRITEKLSTLFARTGTSRVAISMSHTPLHACGVALAE